MKKHTTRPSGDAEGSNRATADAAFRIGHAAGLSGVSADTIRIWERRYQALTPSRDGSNMRVYSQQDVDRLRLMSQLIEAGARISDIARLDETELRDRLAESKASFTEEMSDEPIPVVVVGEGLVATLAHIPEIDIRATFGSLPALAEHGRQPGNTTALLRLGHLGQADGTEILRTLSQAGLRRALLLYDFAPSAVLGRLRKRGVMTLRATSDPGEIRHVLLARHYWEHAGRSGAQNHLTAPVPAPRFTARELERARSLRSALACECPRHLADLIGALSAFEGYSTRCEESSSRDAAIHAMLRSATAHARHTMETALERLAQDEGLAGELSEGSSKD